VRTFIAEWEKYVAELEQQAPAAGTGIGRDMDPGTMAGLSDEQRAQLAKLREEARNAMK
jgi:hypothetical protein